MSARKNATNVASPSDTTGTKVPVLAKVIQMPVNNTDYKVHPLTKEAHDLYYQTVNEYVDPTGHQQKECRRHYFSLPSIRDVAEMIGRQVTLEELNLLVGFDGEPVNCSVSNRSFQPMWWLVPNQRLADAIMAHKAVNAEAVQLLEKVGQYFPHPQQQVIEHFAVCGVPFYWTKTEDCKVAFFSFWHQIYKRNAYRWGTTASVSNSVLAERKSRMEQEATLRDGLNRVGDIFAQAQTSGDKWGRRRKFVPSNMNR